MLRWLLVFVIAMVVFQGALVWLHKVGLGKLPGDFTLRVGQRKLYLPIGSALVLSAIAAGVSWLI